MFNNEITRHTNNRKVWPIQRNKLTKAVPEKDPMVDLLQKDFKTTALKMLKELKKDVEKNQENKIYKKWKYLYRDIYNLKINQKPFWS